MGLFAIFVSTVYLIYIAVSGAPKDDPLDQKYWNRWTGPFWAFCWIAGIVDEVSEARAKGWWWTISLMVAPILVVAAFVGARLVSRSRRQDG